LRRVTDLLIRPMRAEDVPVAEQVSADAFLQVDLARARPDEERPERRPAARRDDWIARTESLVRTDGPGCWVAERDGRVLGFATSLRREVLWALVTFAVVPGEQGSGIGRLLLDAALRHSAGCLRGMISSSSDPGAVRRYQAAGFDLHPQMVLAGRVDRSAAPSLGGIRAATAADRELMDSADRRCRGAARGDDHDLLAARSTHALVLETRAASGYAYVDDRRVLALAATSRAAATRLLWAAVLTVDGPVKVPHVTGANQWALRVGLTAGLTVRTQGYLALGGMAPPAPYLHDGALL
jgi:GNAT superfamily N-acetyltransferase